LGASKRYPAFAGTPDDLAFARTSRYLGDQGRPYITNLRGQAPTLRMKQSFALQLHSVCLYRKPCFRRDSRYSGDQFTGTSPYTTNEAELRSAATISAGSMNRTPTLMRSFRSATPFNYFNLRIIFSALARALSSLSTDLPPAWAISGLPPPEPSTNLATSSMIFPAW